MRNLRNIKYETWRSPDEFSVRSITATAWDTSSDSAIVAYGPSEHDTLVELVRVNKKGNKNEHSVITSWDAPCPNPDLACDEILSLYYFGDSQTACLVLAGGDIVVVREEPLPGEDRIEIVGSVDAGITAARWSPDEELLAITTKADTVIFMSRSFEGIMDVTMTADDQKASNHVNVGWGKKETQFKGRGANALRDPTMPEKVDEGLLSPNDKKEATISWRGDGAYVAISTVQEGLRRLIRVYSREGVLDSVSEPVDNLEGALSWRPAGNLMAGVQRLSDRIDIVFFERNGLRHGQFSLRLTPEEMETFGKNISLAWNNDSSVLAVIFEDRVQFWTMGNYHWYLKQEIATKTTFANSLVWHQEKVLRMIVANADGINIAEYIFTVARSSTIPPHDYGAVAVIDGKNVKLTPLRSANVPPPMAHYELLIRENTIDVAFNAETSRIAVLHQSGIEFYDWVVSGTTSSSPTLSGRVTFEKNSESTHLHASFDKDGNVLVLRRNLEDGTSSISFHGFDSETGRMVETKPQSQESAISLSSFEQDGKDHAFIQGSSGDVHSTDTAADASLNHCKLPAFLPWVEIIQHGEDVIAFGLSPNGHLYANSRCLAKNCTSFLTTPLHLIFTTTTHMLKFVHITDVQELEVPNDDPEKDERCRALERGSRLVTAMPTSLSLVLQMPRGNLETIWPRAMVLAGIRKLIAEKNYKRAFSHCRTQRVDMNLLYDYQPEQFLANVGLFVDQVKKITYIDLFLSSLRGEDVTQTLYKDTRVLKPSATVPNANGLPLAPPTSTTTSKVNRVCDAMLSILSHRQSTNLKNIITAHLCKSPPALDDGLKVVALLMSSDQSMADKAVEHICFLADVNKLYEHALGLYNLDLALLVAQQSQKDPREYLPFLQKLQEMPVLRRQFSIDDHLGRHAKALTSLRDSSPPDETAEIDAYIVKHALYKPALTLYRYVPARLSEITHLYAVHLEAKSQFHAAALAYESLRLYSEASHCYHLASPSYWREALFCLSLTSPSPSALSSLAESLADSLAEIKSYFDAATIHATYLGSPTAAARLFCKGSYFAAAFELATSPIRPCPELLEANGIIDTGLTDALGVTTELLAECKGQLNAQVPRIRELRERALADPLAFYEGEASKGDADIPDDISVAASGVSTSASLFTRYTGRQSLGTAATGASRVTSKNRRREERKRARGKKGSVYEEEYLVASVGRLIERAESTREEIQRLVEGLVRRGMREGALAVEALGAEVVQMCKDSVKEVYGQADETKEVEEGEVDENGYRPIGGDAVLAESMEASQRAKVAPVIGEFKKLSLLGV
ncbi:putative elongator complex protein 1 [Pseudogymnoascus australis]